MDGKSAVAMTSGGMDSTVLLYWLMSNGYAPTPMFVDYGQHCAATEIETLRQVMPSELAGHLHVVDVSDVFGSSKSRLIREADLWRESVSSADIMLPYRNLFLLVTGAAFAASRDITTLFSAFINSNHAYELDATTTFLAGVEGLVGSVGNTRIEMPFKNLSKAEVAKLGLSLGVPIGRTFSCQVNSEEHCGACPNCVERLTALNHVVAEAHS